MDTNVIKLVTFGAVAVVVVAYVAFIRWRIRIHRSRAAGETDRRAATDTRSSHAMLRPDATSPRPTSEPAPDGPPVRAPATPDPPDPADPNQRAETVLDAVRGISLPHDLVPHPDATPRPGAADRVALIGTSIDFEPLRDGIAAALSDLGYEVVWDDTQGLARRGATELRVDLYPAPRTVLIDGAQAFPLATEGAVVVDFWLLADA